MNTNKKQYLIIAETDDTGYIVEIHKEMDKAIERAELYFDLAFNPGFMDFEQLEKEFLELISYKIREQHVLEKDVVWGTTNGFYSVDVIEIGPDFKLRDFLMERMNVKRLFNLEQHLEKLDCIDEELKMSLLKLWVN